MLRSFEFEPDWWCNEFASRILLKRLLVNYIFFGSDGSDTATRIAIATSDTAKTSSVKGFIRFNLFFLWWRVGRSVSSEQRQRQLWERCRQQPLQQSKMCNRPWNPLTTSTLHECNGLWSRSLMCCCGGSRRAKPPAVDAPAWVAQAGFPCLAVWTVQAASFRFAACSWLALDTRCCLARRTSDLVIRTRFVIQKGSSKAGHPLISAETKLRCNHWT